MLMTRLVVAFVRRTCPGSPSSSWQKSIVWACLILLHNMAISRSHYRRKVQAAKSTNRTIAIIVQSPPVLSRMREIFQYCNKLKINNSSKFKKVRFKQKYITIFIVFYEKRNNAEYKIFYLVNRYFYSYIISESLWMLSVFILQICLNRVSWYYIIILHNRSQLCLTNVRVREGNVSIINSACDLLPNYVCRSVKHVAQLPNLTMIRICAFFALYTKKEINPSIYSCESATISSPLSDRMLRNCLIVNERYSPLITSCITYVPLIAFLRAARQGYRKYIEERSRAFRSKIVRLVNFRRKRWCIEQFSVPLLYCKKCARDARNWGERVAVFLS